MSFFPWVPTPKEICFHFTPIRCKRGLNPVKHSPYFCSKNILVAATRYPAYIRRAKATNISRIELIVRLYPGNFNLLVPKWRKSSIDSFEFTENKCDAYSRNDGPFWNGGL
jgi:hypothetical protein